MNELKLAKYIKNDLTNITKQFDNEFIGSEIMLENIEKYQPIDFELLKKYCLDLNVKIKINLKKKSILATMF